MHWSHEESLVTPNQRHSLLSRWQYFLPKQQVRNYMFSPLESLSCPSRRTSSIITQKNSSLFSSHILASLVNISSTCLALSEKYLERRVAVLIWINFVCLYVWLRRIDIFCARPWHRVVFPVPGGPYSRIRGFRSLVACSGDWETVECSCRWENLPVKDEQVFPMLQSVNWTLKYLQIFVIIQMSSPLISWSNTSLVT